MQVHEREKERERERERERGERERAEGPAQSTHSMRREAEREGSGGRTEGLAQSAAILMVRPRLPKAVENKPVRIAAEHKKEGVWEMKGKD